MRCLYPAYPSMNPQSASTVNCETHGPSHAAVVCQHLIGEADWPKGFIENSADPSDLQGWCFACEEKYLAEGDLTEAFRQFNAFKVVCAACYADIKTRHSMANGEHA